MTDTAAPPAKAATGLTWQLVHAEPGALIYAAIPGVPPAGKPTDGELNHAGRWAPGGVSDVSGGPARHHADDEHPLLHYAGYIGRVGLLAAALGVGATLAGRTGVAWAETGGSDSSSSPSASSSNTADSRSRTPARTQRNPSQERRGPGQGITPRVVRTSPTTEASDPPQTTRRTSNAATPTASEADSHTLPSVAVPTHPDEQIPRSATAQVPADVTPGPEVAAAPPRAAIAVRTMDRIRNAVMQPLITPNTPAGQAAKTPALWGLMAWARRTLLNQNPTPAGDPNQTTQVDGRYTVGTVDHATGTVQGELQITAPGADPLSYSVTGGPADGSVTLTADGTFTYTPTAGARHDASADNAGPAESADSFTVTVEDNHGRVVNIPVKVAIDPTNTAPTITRLTVSDPNTDGTVTVSINVTDPDADPVTYLVVHDPAYGTVAPTPGGFAYTPDAEARSNLTDATAADKVDTFTVAVNDAHGGVISVPVAVPIPVDSAAPAAVAAAPRPATARLTAPINKAIATATKTASATTTTTTTTSTVEAEKMTVSGAGRAVADSNASGGYAIALSGSATASTTVTIPASTMVTIRVRSGAGAPNMKVTIDGVPVTTVLVSSGAYSDYRFAGAIAAGSHVISISSTTATSGNKLYIDKVVTTTGPVVDEFVGKSGSAPSSGLWNVRTGTGFDSGIETYAAGNAFLDGQGHLVIQARSAKAGGYTSGSVWSKNNVSFGYGTITARIKMPKGQGLTPSFWLMGADSDTVGWPQSGEIDVVELPSTTTTVYSTLHGPITGSTDTQQAQITANLPDLSTDYHNYWVRHLENEITFGVDDQTLGTLTPDSLGPGGTWVYNRPMYVFLNIQVGGPWAGAPNSSTPFPATMMVESVRWDPPA